MAKFFHYNAIPFNAADSGPYYQTMINIIAEADPGVKGPTGYQIGNLYLEEEMNCLLYTSPSPRDRQKSRMPSSA